MKSYVLDASALLRFFEDGPGAARVEDLINQAEGGRVRLLLSAVNWGEVYYVIRRARGKEEAESQSYKFRSIPVEVVDVDWQRAERAGAYRQKFRIPYADAFAAALAAEHTAILLTGDYDFKTIENVIKVEFLPAKQKGAAQ
jgi:predicted nucleic acid-binding protein